MRIIELACKTRGGKSEKKSLEYRHTTARSGGGSYRMQYYGKAPERGNPGRQNAGREYEEG